MNSRAAASSGSSVGSETQEKSDSRPVVKCLDLDAFRRRLGNSNRPMDLRRHRKLRCRRCRPGGRRGIIHRQRTLDERSPHRHALLAVRKVRSGHEAQPQKPARAYHPFASTSYSHAILLTLTRATRAGYSDSSRCPRFLSRSVILTHDDFPDPFVRKFHFPSRHRRFPWHPFDRKADAALLDSPEEIAFLEHRDRRGIGKVGRRRIESPGRRTLAVEVSTVAGGTAAA